MTIRFRRALALLLFVPVAATAESPPPSEYRPLLTFEPKGLLIQGALTLAGRLEGVSSFALDRDGTRFDAGAAIAPQIRLSVRFDTRDVWKPIAILAEYEHDLLTGAWSSVDVP